MDGYQDGQQGKYPACAKIDMLTLSRRLWRGRLWWRLLSNFFAYPTFVLYTRIHTWNVLFHTTRTFSVLAL
jgi:hypothetical protein